MDHLHYKCFKWVTRTDDSPLVRTL